MLVGKGWGEAFAGDPVSQHTQVERIERLRLPAGTEISAPRFYFLFFFFLFWQDTAVADLKPESIPFLLGISPGQLPSPPQAARANQGPRSHLFSKEKKKKLALRRGGGKKKSRKIFLCNTNVVEKVARIWK